MRWREDCCVFLLWGIQGDFMQWSGAVHCGCDCDVRWMVVANEIGVFVSKELARRRCDVNAFLRWIVIIVFTMTLAFPVLAQTNQGFPGGVTQFAGGTI